MLNATQLSALGLAAAVAVATEKGTKLPAELSVPLWALRSDWGAKQPGNNCFGIMAAPEAGAQPALEVFPTLQACFDAQAATITTAKANAAAWAQYLKNGDKAMFIQRVAPGFSSNDLLYTTKLARVLQMSEVRGAIAEARKPLVNIQTPAAVKATPAATTNPTSK